jgi:transcriptional regulator with XRE-family HTH domain
MSTYAERLAEAIEHRSAQIGREVTRLELANAAGCSRQNIGMILTNAQGDQKLSTDKHAKAAAFLKVNPDWLLNGTGEINSPKHYTLIGEPGELKRDVSGPARELAKLYDLIPASDLVKRARAYNAASSAILDVLQEKQPID